MTLREGKQNKEKTNGTTSTQIFHNSEGKVYQKEKHTGWKMFVHHISIRGLIFQIHKVFIKLKIKTDIHLNEKKMPMVSISFV